MTREQISEIAATVIETPIGKLRVEASPRGLRRIVFDGGAPRAAKAAPAAQEHLARAVKQLREYFDGRRDRFDLKLELEGTAHQQRVWRALLGIPYGQTLTYGELAGRLGSPRGARAVGRACATNPVPVVVPCHRVLGGNGALHGFGGGLWRKRTLLELESNAAGFQLR
jgi:methylated-DNA-[protein]-cysteine S-methyltransferase